MTAIAYYAGRIPGVPSKRDRGEKRIHKALENIRGDADVVGIVRTNDGWDFVPGDIVDEGDEEWVVPTNSDRQPYPADGIPDTPPTLFGVPVTIGYRNFGCLNEVPNVNFIDRSISLEELVYDHAIDAPATDGESTATNGEPDQADGNDPRGRLASAWDRFGDWRQRRRLSTGWGWLQHDAEALVLQQDGDAALSIERLDYDLKGDGPEWYISRKTEYYFDARGHGAAPQTIETAKLGLAYGPVPKLIAPSICRIARNMQAEQLTTGTEQQARQQRVAADGGVRKNDIIVEERAMVWPADSLMLGAPKETQEAIKTAERQVLAKENTGGILDNLGTLGKIGIVMLLFVVGAQFGDPSGMIEMARAIFGGLGGAI